MYEYYLKHGDLVAMALHVLNGADYSIKEADDGSTIVAIWKKGKKHQNVADYIVRITGEGALADSVLDVKYSQNCFVCQHTGVYLAALHLAELIDLSECTVRSLAFHYKYPNISYKEWHTPL